MELTVLPLANIILKKYLQKDECFNPEKFLEKLYKKKYFELLVKKNMETRR